MHIKDDLNLEGLYKPVIKQYNRIQKIFLNYVPSVLANLNGKVLKNHKLKNAATRISTPVAFKPYIELMEQSLEVKFPENLIFTKEEVISSDLKTISSFSNTNYDTSKLNFTTLVRASIQSFIDLGVFTLTGELTLTTEESASSFPKSTSSGFPVFKDKSNPLAVEDAIEFAESFLAEPSFNKLLNVPTAVFHRFQYKFSEALDDLIKKIRAIWGISFRVGVIEGVFFRKIVEGVRNYQYSIKFPFMATGLRGVEVSERIIKHFRRKFRKIYSIDVESFDSNVPTFMWIMFYSILISGCILTANEILALTSLCVFHNFTPFVYMDTKLQFQKKGIPSGSLITQIFGSFVSRTVLNYAYFEKFGEPALDRGTVLGDDNLVSGDDLTLEYIVSVYKRFGLTVNESKCTVSRYNEPIQFLGRVWDASSRPTAPIKWYMAHLALPSKFYTNLPFSVAEFQTYRALSIVAPLYNGLQTFERLVGWGDFIYQQLLKEFERDPSLTKFKLISNIESENLKNIPFAMIKFGGWKRF